MSNVAAIILAAGQASRFRAADASVSSKVIAQLDGKALVRHVAEAALMCAARPVIVVTGNAREDVENALKGVDVRFVHNADFAAGLSGSVRAGIAALDQDCRGALILLADMPRIRADFLASLLQTFAQQPDADAVVPLYKGQRGNPVLISRSLFKGVSALKGDEGARRILNDPDLNIIEVAGEEDVTLDIDTREALAEAARAGSTKTS